MNEKKLASSQGGNIVLYIKKTHLKVVTSKIY